MQSVLPWLITKHLLLTVLQSEGENSALSISLMTNAAVLIGGWMEAAGWDHMLTAPPPSVARRKCRVVSWLCANIGSETRLSDFKTISRRRNRKRAGNVCVGRNKEREFDYIWWAVWEGWRAKFVFVHQKANPASLSAAVDPLRPSATGLSLRRGWLYGLWLHAGVFVCGCVYLVGRLVTFARGRDKKMWFSFFLRLNFKQPWICSSDREIIHFFPLESIVLLDLMRQCYICDCVFCFLFFFTLPLTVAPGIYAKTLHKSSSERPYTGMIHLTCTWQWCCGLQLSAWTDNLFTSVLMAAGLSSSRCALARRRCTGQAGKTSSLWKYVVPFSNPTSSHPLSPTELVYLHKVTSLCSQI